jgi:hypothetical protein
MRGSSRRLLLASAASVVTLLCGCSGPSESAASPHFCQPVKWLIGTDAVEAVRASHGPTSAVPFIGATFQLERDIKASLSHAPTAQLRRELVRYQQSITGVGSSEAVLSAMNRFDRVAGTQLSSCGVVSIHG